MLLFAGLGNPGPKHAGNRHNIGFMALDAIAADHGFPPWRARFQGEVSEGRLGTEKVILIKPLTFMNLSGQAVGEAARFYKIEPPAITVFHDELDLAPGRVKLKSGGGHAGHNGLRSLQSHIGPDFARVRLGIGHPGHKDRVSPWVLGDFAKSDGDWLDDLLRGIADGAPALADGDDANFLNAIALRRPPPPKESKAAPAAAPTKPIISTDVTVGHPPAPPCNASRTGFAEPFGGWTTQPGRTRLGYGKRPLAQRPGRPAASLLAQAADRFLPRWKLQHLRRRQGQPHGLCRDDQ